MTLSMTLLAATFLVTTAATAASPHVTVIDIGAPDYLGSPRIHPQGINDLGEVVGYGILGGPQPLQAFVWSHGKITLLPAPGADPGLSSFGLALNNRGQVAGYTTIGGVKHSIIWDGGSFKDISAPGGDSYPIAVNDNGQALLVEQGKSYIWSAGSRVPVEPFNVTATVGLNNSGQIFGSGSDDGGPEKAFIWSQGEETQASSFGLTTTTTDINNRGQVIGYGAVARPPYHTHGYLWSPAVNGRRATQTDIGSISGRDTEALAVNDRGQVVGRSATSSGWHAFRWEGGRMTDLGVLPGGTSSNAVAINEDGQAAGWSYAADGKRHAVMWNGGKIVDLGIPDGFFLSYAIGINKSGQVLGYGFQEGTGAVHTFVWSTAG
ncbi:Extracellular HAF [Frankia sp. Hr75.2]|nr:Extracellular HAF [Frankia sp. Hr75.2]